MLYEGRRHVCHSVRHDFPLAEIHDEAEILESEHLNFGVWQLLRWFSEKFERILPNTVLERLIIQKNLSDFEADNPLCPYRFKPVGTKKQHSHQDDDSEKDDLSRNLEPRNDIN